VARKKRKPYRWLRTLLLFVVTPVSVWLLAFVIWLLWQNHVIVVAPDKTPLRPGSSSVGSPKPSQSPDDPSATRTRENIPDEDRKRLDEILRGR
jgi:hypothetical protein